LTCGLHVLSSRQLQINQQFALPCKLHGAFTTGVAEHDTDTSRDPDFIEQLPALVSRTNYSLTD